MNAGKTDRLCSLSLSSKNPLPPKVIAFRQNSRSPDSNSSYFSSSSRLPSDIAKNFVLPTVTGVVKAYTLFPFKLCKKALFCRYSVISCQPEYSGVFCVISGQLWIQNMFIIGEVHKRVNDFQFSFSSSRCGENVELLLSGFPETCSLTKIVCLCGYFRSDWPFSNDNNVVRLNSGGLNTICNE